VKQNLMKGQHFQDHAFDKALKGRRPEHDLLQLVGSVDGDKISQGMGFQIKNIRREDKQPQEWTRTKAGIQKVLLTAFPKLLIDAKQRKKAGRWAQFIQLYFQLGWTESEVAGELETKLSTVHSLRRNIVRASRGLRADGSGPRVNMPQLVSIIEGGEQRPSEPLPGDVPKGAGLPSLPFVTKGPQWPSQS
jgi:hypothetical protein